MAQKKTYRIRNWSEYNKALVNRGSLTVWFDEDTVSDWYNKEHTGQRGRPQDYSNTAILCALTLRNLFRLPLRATEGFISSLIELLGLPITAPTYSTLSRRQGRMKVPSYKNKSKAPAHLVVDATGIKVFGEGEWKMRQHGKEKRRSWCKLHIAVNEATHDIVMSVVTNATTPDCKMLGSLLSSTTELNVNQVTGDGAYDTHDCYQAAINIGATPCFPPKINAARHKATDEAWRLRNHAVGRVRDYGLQEWKKRTNYHRRSLSETAFSRLKKIFGTHISSRNFDNQAAELMLRCNMLNRMNELGMPVVVIK